MRAKSGGGPFRLYRPQRAISLSDLEHPTVDARGLNCPLPLLKLKKLLATRPGAAAYVLLATDPDTVADITRLAAREGYGLAISHEPDGTARYVLSAAV